MRIQEVTWRHRNDFHYKAECEHCGNVDTYRDGYADDFYCTQVVPNRHCCDCGLNSHGKAAEVAQVERTPLSTDDVSSMGESNAPGD